MARSEEMQKDAFLVLYRAGWSDTAIALTIHRWIRTIKRWREEAGLPRNRHRIIKIDDARARAMHQEGASDQRIARELGLSVNGVFNWRTSRGLPANFVAHAPTAPDRIRKAKKMLRQGATANQVAEQVGVCAGTILRLRRRMKGEPGLRKQGHNTVGTCRRMALDAEIMHRIQRAIGTSIPPEFREDAVADLQLAVLEGRISPDQIETASASFRNQAYGLVGSKYGARSLDEELGDEGDGFTLMDTLEDTDALVSMEEAAAYAYDNDDY